VEERPLESGFSRGFPQLDSKRKKITWHRCRSRFRHAQRARFHCRQRARPAGFRAREYPLHRKREGQSTTPTSPPNPTTITCALWPRPRGKPRSRRESPAIKCSPSPSTPLAPASFRGRGNDPSRRLLPVVRSPRKKEARRLRNWRAGKAGSDSMVRRCLLLGVGIRQTTALAPAQSRKAREVRQRV